MPWRDLAIVLAIVMALGMALDYAELVEARLARLERRPAVIIGGKWSEHERRHDSES